jgi:hypothetical protein
MCADDVVCSNELRVQVIKFKKKKQKQNLYRVLVGGGWGFESDEICVYLFSFGERVFFSCLVHSVVWFQVFIPVALQFLDL